MSKIRDILEKKYGTNTPILLEEILSDCADVTPDAVYRRLRKACDAGEIVKKERGVYYIPTQTAFGKSNITSTAVLSKKYIKRGEVVIGYLAGTALENAFGITTQTPAVLEIVTNAEATNKRSIGAYGGYREVILRKPRTQVTNKNADALACLELLTSIEMSRLDRQAQLRFFEVLKQVGVNALREHTAFFPAKTSKRLIECEAQGVFA